MSRDGPELAQPEEGSSRLPVRLRSQGALLAARTGKHKHTHRRALANRHTHRQRAKAGEGDTEAQQTIDATCHPRPSCSTALVPFRRSRLLVRHVPHRGHHDTAPKDDPDRENQPLPDSLNSLHAGADSQLGVGRGNRCAGLLRRLANQSHLLLHLCKVNLRAPPVALRVRTSTAQAPCPWAGRRQAARSPASRDCGRASRCPSRLHCE